jgi:hypothetical protein
MATAEENHELECWISGKLKPGSIQEREARRIVARLLRAGDFTVQRRLAITVDPDNADADPNGAQMFFKRRPGNRSKLIDFRNVAAFIWQEEQAGRKRKAYARAVVELGVSLRTAKEAYKIWRPAFKEFGSKVKALTLFKK